MTPEELAILKALVDGKSVEQVSGITKLKPESVGRAVAKLQLEGMISDDGTVTEKGARASKIE
jgi:predicted transcriptional regulator